MYIRADADEDLAPRAAMRDPERRGRASSVARIDGEDESAEQRGEHEQASAAGCAASRTSVSRATLHAGAEQVGRARADRPPVGTA